MPNIRWEVDPVFRRAVASTLAAWDFRDHRELAIVLPGRPTQVAGSLAPVPDPISEKVVLRVDIDMAVEDGKAKRTFVVRPRGPEDARLISEWVERDRERRAWLKEDLT